jgi:hypothetical protein
VSRFECMISEAERNNGGALSTKGFSGSRNTEPTSVGIRSGWVAQTTAQNSNRAAPFAIVGEVTKMRQEEPTTACAISKDHTCARMFSKASKTLYLSSEKRAPICRW